MRLAPALLALALVGCTPEAPIDTYEQGETAQTPADAYRISAETWDVPVEILQAVAYAQTGMQSISGEVEFDGKPKVSGLMGMREDIVDEAAELSGHHPDNVRGHFASNVDAAAAWLSEEADAQGIDRRDLAAWAPVVIAFAGIDHEDAAASYVWDEIYAAIAQGVEFEGGRLPPTDVSPNYSAPAPRASGGDRSYAIYRRSPNQSSRPSGSAGDPSMVIIHTCEGSYSGCWGWLSNPNAGASAHYVVNSNGSEVTQLVSESAKAWHIAARYDCSLNSGVDCWRNNSGSNNFTVGIEHAGYASQSSWSGGLLDTSERLVCDITRDHGIPRDRYHIVGHGQLQPYNRTDPGANWPWTRYIDDIRTRCGDSSTGSTGSSGGGTSGGTSGGSTGGEIVIDSNNHANVPNTAMIEVSANWTSSNNVGGYYNTGYWWRSAGASSDSARFKFNLQSDGCYAVKAWWSAASDRSPAAPFLMTDSTGAQVGRVDVDQRSNGGRWNQLGTYNFTAGWNSVDLSRWTSSGVVIADAVKLVPSTNCTGTSSGGTSSGSTTTPSTPAMQITIDSDNANNDAAAAEFEASGSWTSTSYTSGFYGSDYAYRSTGASSDLASFWFYAETDARVDIEARWTAGSNRATAAPYMVYNAEGTLLGTARMDQTRNHATWVSLGTYDVTEGWNQVALSRWTTEGSVVIADAVRVTEVP